MACVKKQRKKNPEQMLAHKKVESCDILSTVCGCFRCLSSALCFVSCKLVFTFVKKGLRQKARDKEEPHLNFTLGAMQQ